MIIFDPEGLRGAAQRLMTLATQVRSDPESGNSVAVEVAAQLRELAGERVSESQAALAQAADKFEAAASAVSADSIEEYARRLQTVADKQESTIDSVNSLFRS